MMHVTFLDHSGFLVELPGLTLLFDWWQGDLPPLPSGPLLVFASHRHPDHFAWYRDDDKILSYGATYTVQPDDIGHSMYVWAEGTGNTTGSATSRITSEVKAN